MLSINKGDRVLLYFFHRVGMEPMHINQPTGFLVWKGPTTHQPVKDYTFFSSNW